MAAEISLVPVGTDAEGHHSVTSRDIGNLAANTRDNTTALDAKMSIPDLAHSNSHVVWVETDGLDLDFDLIIPERSGGFIIVPEHKTFQVTSLLELHLQWPVTLLQGLGRGRLFLRYGIRLLHRGGENLAETLIRHHPDNVQAVVPLDKLVLVSA